jgi:hypothetical protein
MFHNPTGGAMKRWLAVLGVLLAGALLLPQHAWSQGAIVNDGLQVKGTSPYIQFSNGNTGTLQPASLSTSRTWTLPNDDGTILLSSTSFGAAATSDATVSGTYNALDIQLQTGVVGTSEIADGTIVDADISSTAGIAVSKLAGGSSGQVLVTDASGTPTWANISVTETDPVWTADKAGATTISGTWTFSNTINGSISGNAGTATALQTARNFALSGDVTASAVSFNGTADVTLSTTIANDAVTSAKIADGTIVNADIASNAGIAVSKLAGGSSGQVLVTDASGTPTWANISVIETDPVWTADKAGATTISGTWTFSNTINGSISGNAGTATALQTARNFALSGDVTASAVSFNGTADVTLSTTIANDAVTSAKIADGTIVNADIASNAGIAVSKLAGGSSGQVLVTDASGTPTWANISVIETDPVWTADKAGATTISGTWTFSNTINGSISGNAGTATALQTARNFALSGDVTASAVSFNGTADVTLSTTIANDAVTSAKIADGTIVNADIASNAGIAVSKLAGGSSGQVLVTDASGTPTWANISVIETDPVWTADKAGATTISGTWTFSNTINGSISGNAGTATALQTARNFALSGDVTASAVSFNGTADVTLSTTIANDAVTSAKIADGTIVNADIASNAGIAVSKLAGGSSGQVLVTDASGTPTWANISVIETDPVWTADKAGATTISGTWTFSNTINGSISGNAGTATALQTARNFALSGDVTASAVSFNGTADVTLSTTIANDAVTSAKIADGTIVNADIASNAGIAVSKLAGGSSGQVLVTDASGTPTWTNLSAAGGWAVGGNNLGGGGTGILGTTSNDNLEVQTNGTLAMYIKALNQYVGIGTSNPQSRLHVHGSAVRVTNSSTGSGANDGFVIGLSGSDAELRQNENASILFNTNAAAGGDTVEAQLTSTGQLAFFTTGTPGFRVDLPNNSANAVGRIRATGISFWSSMRWKEDIRPIPNALEKVLALRGVNFRWKPEYGGGEDMGFIMEEVDRVVPEVVQRDERTGELLGMDYSRLTALLVEALKEEHRRNEALRAEVAELRSLVEQLLRQNGERGTGSQPSTIQDAWLGQNIPNPFAGTTTIPYYIPAGVSRAELVVRDVGGRELRRLELAERGAHGQVVLEMGLLGSGTYEYALVLDGRVVAVKQMTLVR